MITVESLAISHETLTFVLTPDKTICKTPLQTFTLRPKEYCWSKHYQNLRLHIEKNEITTMSELVDRCNNKIDFIISNYE